MRLLSATAETKNLPLHAVVTMSPARTTLVTLQAAKNQSPEGRVQERNVGGIVTKGGGKLVATLPQVFHRRHAAASE